MLGPFFVSGALLLARQRTIKINITGDASGATAQLSGLDSIFAAIQSRFVQLLGVAGLFAVIRGLKNAASAAIDLAKDFERSMSLIVGLVGESRDQVAIWKEDIKDLSPATGQPLRELADALFFVSSSGIAAADAMSVVEVAAKASAAGLGETKIIADAVTSAINAYGIENLSAAEATDILIAAVREGKAEPEEFAQVIGRLLPLSSELGVEFNEVGAALASMSLLGLDAAEAATAIRGIMSALIKPTAEGARELDRVGLSFEELRRQAREEGLLQVLFTLRDTFGENEEAMARVFGNVRALTGVLNLVGQNAEQVEQVFSVMTETTGELDRAFGAASETSGFKMEQALARLQVVGLEVGDKMLPQLVEAIERIVPSLETVLPALGELVIAMMEFGNSVLPTMLVVFNTLGPVFKGLGFIANTLIGTWDEGARAAADFTSASEAMKESMEEGNDPAVALANSLQHLISEGTLTESKFRELAAASGITDERLDDVRRTLIEYNNEQRQAKSRTESMRDTLKAWVDEGIVPSREELERLGIKVTEGTNGFEDLRRALHESDGVINANILTTAELAELLGTTTTEVYGLAASDRALIRAAEDVTDAQGHMGESSRVAGEHLVIQAGQAETLEGKLQLARFAQESLSDVLRAAADPVFNAVNLFRQYNDKLAEYEEALKDPETSTQDLANLQIELAEAALEAQGGLDAINSENLEDALAAIATSLGITTGEAADLLRELGILDGKHVTAVVQVKAPVIKYEYQTDTGDLIPRRVGSREFARGGIVTGPTMGIIGEAGSPEAVIPLNDRGVKFLAEALREAIGSSDGARRSSGGSGLFDGATLVFQGTSDSMVRDLSRKVGFEIRWATG